MAALLPTVQARIVHLQTCKRAGTCGASYLNIVRDTRTIILNSITNYPHTIPVETASALIASVVEDGDLFDLQDRCAIVESVNAKTCQNDYVPTVADQRGNDRVTSEKLLPRQSMYHVENYFHAEGLVEVARAQPREQNHGVSGDWQVARVSGHATAPRKVLGSFGRHTTMGHGRPTRQPAEREGLFKKIFRPMPDCHELQDRCTDRVPEGAEHITGAIPRLISPNVYQ